MSQLWVIRHSGFEYPQARIAAWLKVSTGSCFPLLPFWGGFRFGLLPVT